MATQSENVSARLRDSGNSSASGMQGEVYSVGSSEASGSKGAESYVGPPPRLPKGQYSNTDIDDAVQPVGHEARVSMGTVLYTPRVENVYAEAPVGNPNSEAKGSGARYNTGKSPLKFVPLHLLDGCARVFQKATTRPVNPYPAWNWAKGMAWSVPYECMLRHLEAWYRGEDTDPDSGESHLAHVLCNALMLTHYYDAYPEGDDRPKNEFKV